jgi:hypothetical protein
MSLGNLFRELGHTDKHTTHSYDWFYEPLLRHKKESAKQVLEIGVSDFGGGDLTAFGLYFANAQVHGIDIKPTGNSHGKNVTVHVGNGYDPEFLKQFDGIEWDVVLDDGPHTKESQVFALNYFHTKLAPEGILLVEDVVESNIPWIIHHFKGDKNKLSVINRKHTSNTPANDEFILLYM